MTDSSPYQPPDADANATSSFLARIEPTLNRILIHLMVVAVLGGIGAALLSYVSEIRRQRHNRELMERYEEQRLQSAEAREQERIREAEQAKEEILPRHRDLLHRFLTQALSATEIVIHEHVTRDAERTRFQSRAYDVLHTRVDVAFSVPADTTIPDFGTVTAARHRWRTRIIRDQIRSRGILLLDIWELDVESGELKDIWDPYGPGSWMVIKHRRRLR